MTKTFEVGVDGSISGSDHQDRPFVRESRMPEILEGFKDQNFSAAKITRLITEEVALLVQEMSGYDENDPTSAFKLKKNIAQIEAMHAMEKLLEKSERACDVLNFDSPQFLCAFKLILLVLDMALTDSIGNDSFRGPTAISVMSHFRSRLKDWEQQIRDKTAKTLANDPNVKGTWSDAIKK
jgi:hypothetical protein